MNHTPEERMRKAAEILRVLADTAAIGCCEGVQNEDDPKHDEECLLWEAIDLLEENKTL
jgi:hypothetical protein